MAQRSSTIDLKVTTFQLDFWIYGCAGTRLHLDVCDQQCLWEWLHPVISTGFCGPNNISAVKLLQNWGPKLGISCYVLLNVMVFKFGNCVISWSNYAGNPGPDRKQNIWWASLQDPQVQLLSTGSHPICVNDVTILTIIFGNIYNILQWSVNMIYIYEISYNASTIMDISCLFCSNPCDKNHDWLIIIMPGHDRPIHTWKISRSQNNCQNIITIQSHLYPKNALLK